MIVNGKRFAENSTATLDKEGLLCYHVMAESVSAHANMAQVVEQLTRNEQVEGSSPSIGSLDGWMINPAIALVGMSDQIPRCSAAW